MNKLMKFSFALLAVVFSLASCSESTAQSKEVTQEVAKNTVMTMNIEGMTCAMGCARAIEVELNNIEGVEAAKVDFEAANATLSYNGSLTSESSIVDFVNNYRNGTYKATVAKQSCCASKKKACSAEQKAKCEAAKKSCDKDKKACTVEQKAKCEAAKKSCDKAAKACCKKDEKTCTAEEKAKCEAAKKSCSEKASKACCAKKVEKSCAADCAKPCCAKKESKTCGAECTKPCCAK